MPQTQTKVLIVDGDADVRTAFGKQVRNLPVTVLQAADGAGALAMLGAHDIRLVVSELYLTTGSEKCLVNALGHCKTHARTRVLVHTSHRSPEAQAWARRAGADGYLIRPATDERVRYVVDRLVADTRRRGPQSEPPGTTVTSAK